MSRFFQFLWLAAAMVSGMLGVIVARAVAKYLK